MPFPLAVIFDMDGVLVDTYRAHYQSWLEMAQSAGLNFTEEDFARTFGRTSREIIAKFWGQDLSDEDIAELDAKKEAAFRRIIQDNIPVMPGAVELLQTLHDSSFRLAVGSSGPPENVDLVLDGLRIRELFGAVVTGMDVTRGKPDPQVFQIAAQRLGVAAWRCAVVEDAPLGIAAAHGAGMAAIGIASTGRTREQLADADLVVDSPAELSPEAVRRLVAPAKTSLGAKTIVYPTPVLVVGTYDPEGRPNIMTAAWGGICCSVPPSVNVSLRKATYSYHSIVHRKAFTVSIPSESQVREADYCGIASGRKEDKFARLGLTAVCSDLVDAPYVQEFPLVLECRLTHTAELGLHTLFAGEIMDVKIDEDVLGPNRLPDLSKLRPLVFAPELRQYFGIGAAVGKAFSIGKT